jgi:hypothetical protein
MTTLQYRTFRTAVLSIAIIGFSGCQEIPAIPAVTKTVLKTPPADPRAYTDDIVISESRIYPDASGVKALSGDLRPFWIAEGRVQNTLALRNADSIRIRLYITVPTKTGPDYVDTADVVVKDVPQSATKSFRQSVRLDPPTGKWNLASEVIEAKTSLVIK